MPNQTQLCKDQSTLAFKKLTIEDVTNKKASAHKYAGLYPGQESHFKNWVFCLHLYRGAFLVWM